MKKFGKWLLAHKENADAIQAKDGFMVALRYNIQVRTNCFAHRVTLENGSKSLANILVLWQKVAKKAYTTCRKFKEVQYSNNPYAKGGPQASWDPKTGLPRKNQNKTPASSLSSTANTSMEKAKPAASKAPKGSGYQG